MKKYKVQRVTTTRVLVRLMERRRVKGRWQWICIAMISGRFNASRLEKRLNRP